jgi:hypothetical protein
MVSPCNDANRETTNNYIAQDEKANANRNEFITVTLWQNRIASTMLRKKPDQI